MGKTPYRRPFKSLKQSTYGQNRSTGGAFSDEEFAAFYLGSWTACRSSNVQEARYVQEDEILEVVFAGGATYQYPGITPDLAESFAKAGSKRGWIWDHIDSQGRDAFKVA